MNHKQNPRRNARTLSDDERRAHGQLLRSAETAGDLAVAYSVLRRGSAGDAVIIGAHAGHTIIGTASAGFWQHLQGQVAEACRQRRDGFAMRERLMRTTKHNDAVKIHDACC